MKADDVGEANAFALIMMAQSCMGSYPETRPSILKRFRQDIEKVAGKEIAVKVLDKRFEEGLKELLTSNEPISMGFFSNPFYPKCSNYSPEIILGNNAEQDRFQSAADERLHYAYELAEQCMRRYPNRKLGTTQDRQQELNSYFGSRLGATEHSNSAEHESWLNGSIKNTESIKAKVAERIKQHGESGWQTRCKPS